MEPKKYTVHYFEDIGQTDWYNDQGQLECPCGPAITMRNGYQAWYRSGELHREDGPAVITAEGDKEWYRDGNLHREDGPAVMYADGQVAWYIGGVQTYIWQPKTITPVTN